jgi:hypothetical protein
MAHCACGDLAAAGRCLVIFSVDHVVFAATRQQASDLITTLQGHGFAPLDFHLDFPDDHLASDSVGLQGGILLEFVYETGEHEGPAAWFDEVPRVIGIGFSSDDFSADTAWDGDSGAWTMPEQQGMPSAAGPHEHQSDFYTFVMNRKDGVLQFPELTAGPRLDRITLAGAGSASWRERLQRWLGLKADGESLLAGGTRISFADGPAASVRAGLTIQTSRAPAVIPLATGEIRLIAAPESSS